MQRVNWRFLAGVSAVLVALTALALMVGDEEEVTDGRDAFAACQEFVSRDLKAPATAEFRPYRLVKVEGSGDGPYTVTSSVDSQNAFGALIRSHFICTVQREGDNWRLTRLTMA